MNNDVMITCAITGAGDTVGKHPAIPITPQQIAEAAIEAAKAGATIAHMHVREPDSGKPSRRVELYREVVDRIRDSGTDIIINLTAGMGGDLQVRDSDPTKPGPDSDLVPAMERLAHVEALLPEICTLDCGTLNFGDGDMTYVGTPEMLRKGAKRVQELGVKPELECFDSGHVWMANSLYEEGLIEGRPMYQICLGIPYGAPASTETMLTMRNLLPRDAIWAGFAIGRNQMPFVAQAALLGGHVRVGLEDNLWLEKGVYGSNASLTERAVEILQRMGARPMTPAEGRELLGLKSRN